MSAKNRYSCNVSQQVLSEVVVLWLHRVTERVTERGQFIEFMSPVRSEIMWKYILLVLLSQAYRAGLSGLSYHRKHCHQTKQAAHCQPPLGHMSCSKSHHGTALQLSSVLCCHVHSSQTSSSCCSVHLSHQLCHWFYHLPKPANWDLLWSVSTFFGCMSTWLCIYIW